MRKGALVGSIVLAAFAGLATAGPVAASAASSAAVQAADNWVYSGSYPSRALCEAGGQASGYEWRCQQQGSVHVLYVNKLN